MSVNMWREVQWLDHTGSTNSDVAKEAQRGGAEGFVVATLEQRAGRGRMDRAWVAPPGTSLAFSMLLEPRQERTHWGWLSLLAGIAVHEAIDSLAPETGRVQLKWPNDVLIDGRKVCGILNRLVEHPDGDRAVVGIGINVSISEEPKRLLGSVLECFQPLYEHWQETGEVRDEYQRRCASIGTPLRIVVDERRIVEGTGYGVDEHGRLQVATASGIETFAVGDVIHARLAQ